MKECIFISIFTLTLFAGEAVSQECGADISGGTTPVCYNTSPGTITATGSGGADYTYQWYSTAGVIEGETEQSIEPGALTSTTGFYCKITSEECGTVETPAVTINVDPLSVGGSVTGGSEVCSGSTAGMLTLGGYTGIITKWQSSTDGSTWTDIENISETYTPDGLTATTQFRAVVQSGVCDPEISGPATVTVKIIPEDAGPISGPLQFIAGTSGIVYYISSVADADSYSWSFTGTGVTINGSGSEVTVDFSFSATGGQLSVKGENICGFGDESFLDLEPADKTLNLSLILLEGLYGGSGIMNQAMDISGPRWNTGIADIITVELHKGDDYDETVFTFPGISLRTSGEATMTVPAVLNGSYYITVKHRNSIETTTSGPVSFSENIINRSFGEPSLVYKNNLVSSADGYFLIFGADINQDGVVDRPGDMNEVENASVSVLRGYNDSDANGDGLVDTRDMNLVDNNTAAGVKAELPH